MRIAKFAAILVAFTALTTTTAFAEPPPTDTTSELRKSADDAANAGSAEADANAEKEVAEKAAEVIAGGGEVLPSADSNLKDGVDNMSEAGEVATMLIQAFKDKNWTLVTGLLMMLLIFGLRYFKLTDKLGIEGKGLLALSISIGVVGSVGVELAFIEGTGWQSILVAIGIGISNGLVATGAWEAMKSPLKATLTKTA